MQSVERPGLMAEPETPAIEIPAAPPVPMSEVPAVPGAATDGSGVPSIPPAPAGVAE